MRFWRTESAAKLEMEQMDVRKKSAKRISFFIIIVVIQKEY